MRTLEADASADSPAWHRPRWLRMAVPVAAAVAIGVIALTWRAVFLAGIGQLLVADDALKPADVVVVAFASKGAGALEAADVIHAGFAPRAAVFADPPTVVDREFLRRGQPYENEAERSTRQLYGLGVNKVEVIPHAFAEGTESEGPILRSWCAINGLRAVIIVSPPDHSRRLKRVLRRSMAGQPTEVIVRSARYADFDPEQWWTRRGSTRIGIVELQKLALDVIRHPLS